MGFHVDLLFTAGAGLVIFAIYMYSLSKAAASSSASLASRRTEGDAEMEAFLPKCCETERILSDRRQPSSSLLVLLQYYHCTKCTTAV